MDEQLLAIVEAARAGEHAAAMRRLRAYLKTQPQDADGWAVLGQLAEDDRVRLAALRRAMELDPAQPIAREALSAAPARLATPPPPPRVDFVALRQARETLWPFVPKGEAKRRLGSLVDERRITRQDMLWAAHEAREAHIREAAATLLAGDHHLPHVGMAREDARLVEWPYSRPLRPLGRLMDEGLVSAEDLRQAAWHAVDPHVREAARQLLPEALAVAKALAGAEEAPRERLIALETTKASARPLLIYHGAGYREEAMPYQERQAALKLARELRQTLDGDWTLCLHLLLPDGKSLDGVLLGPPGLFVLALYTEDTQQRYRYRGDKLTTQAGWWRPGRPQPGRLAQAGAEALRQRLTARLGYTPPMEARLVWLSSAMLEVVDPTLPVWRFEMLARDSAALRSLPPCLTLEQRGEIARLLREWQR